MRAAHVLADASLSLPPDSYIYSILDTNDRASNLAAISSDDSLRIFNPDTLQLVSGGTFEKVHRGVTCVRSLNDHGRTLATAGRDGLVHGWDQRTGQKVFSLGDGTNSPYLALDCCPHNTTLAAGTELNNSQATVVIWDYRSPDSPLLQYVESHNDDVTELRYHPAKTAMLLSGSTDGLVNLYDTTISVEDDALYQIVNHGASISHAGFLSETEIFALSHDEALSIYRLTGSDDGSAETPPRIFGDVRPQLECEYVVDLLLTSGQAVLGAGTHSAHRLDIVQLNFQQQWALDEGNAVRLAGAHGQEIVRSLCIDDKSSTMYTAGEDGLVKAWRTVEDVGPAEQVEITKKKRKKAVGSKQARFKPY